MKRVRKKDSAILIASQNINDFLMPEVCELTKPLFALSLIHIYWLGNIFSGIGDAIGGVFDTLGQQISNVIFDTMLQWYYNSVYNAVADFFTMMGNMGADIFKLDWVKATILLRCV